MQSDYSHVVISAENAQQVKEILDALLLKKVVAGGMITQGPAKFWWKGELVEMLYYNISAFTRTSLRNQIVDTVEQISVEEVPGITFSPLDSNQKFLDWIDTSLS